MGGGQKRLVQAEEGVQPAVRAGEKKGVNCQTIKESKKKSKPDAQRGEKIPTSL